MYSGAGKHFKVDGKNVFSTEIHPRSGIQSLYDHEGKQILRYNNTTRAGLKRGFVVTSTQNHRIKHLLNIIKILFSFKIFQDHRIKKFDNNIDLRKVDFLSPEKISERSCFVNKDILQS